MSEGAREEFGLRWIFGTDNAGVSPDPDRIHTGKNSGHQALHLAYTFGARRVVLLGFDYATGSRGERHWHGDHPPGLGNGGWNRYASWIRNMNGLAEGMAAAGVKVMNASRRTALKCFPRVTLETALHEIRNLERVGNVGRLPASVDRALR